MELIINSLKNLPDDIQYIIMSYDERTYDKLYESIKIFNLIKKDGYNIKFVKKQTNKLCMEAVKQNGNSLKYIKNETIKLFIKIFYLKILMFK